MSVRRTSVAVLAAFATTAIAIPAASASPSAPAPAWSERPTGTTAQFRGLAAVSSRTAWLAGAKGTILRTTDGGKTWANVSPPAAAELEFRDIEAQDARRAVALTIGTGADSRVFRTVDGGKSWQETFRNDDPNAFYDCMTFLDQRHGLALSDPVGGKFKILRTADGGRTWQLARSAGMPAALDGEFAFAASGTCLVSQGHRAWFATGGGAQTRVFRSDDGGLTWSATATPFVSGPSAGIYSLAFRDRQHGIAVGGDYTKPTDGDRAAAITSDGGKTWTLVAKETAPLGYRSGAAWIGHTPAALAVGPTGSEYSLDGGRSWTSFDTSSLDSVECTGLACWASGAKGRAAVLTLKR